MDNRTGGQGLVRDLRKQGAYRWLAFFAGMVLLGWLWVFAGQARQPQGVKRQWAVLASRVLAVAGGFVLARLLLWAQEERVPVVFLRGSGEPCADGSVDAGLSSIAALSKGAYEVVPLEDVVMFVRDRRYVPRKSLALVVEVPSLENLSCILASAGGMRLTVILPLKAFEQGEPGKAFHEDLPDSVGLGTALGEGLDRTPPDQGQIVRHLQTFAETSARLLGKRPEYVVAPQGWQIDFRGILKAAGYMCFLDGKGYNRFGDEAYLIRIMDVSRLVGWGWARRLDLSIHLDMFKGTFIGWPLAALSHISMSSLRRGR